MNDLVYYRCYLQSDRGILRGAISNSQPNENDKIYFCPQSNNVIHKKEGLTKSYPLSHESEFVVCFFNDFHEEVLLKDLFPANKIKDDVKCKENMKPVKTKAK